MALVFALSLPAIAMGMVGDDYDLAASVADDPLSAYVFGPRDPDALARSVAAQRAEGVRPWWASNGLRIAFLRPLSSLSHALDFALFGGAPWVMHVENSLLLVGIVWLVFLIYGRLGLQPAALALATFFYAFNGNHSMTVGWIAGRNTLLATLLGLIAVWLHLRARDEQRPDLLAAAVGCLGAALLSAEGAVASLAYISAHALVLDTGTLRARMLRLWPYALVLVAWRAAYALGGYGVVGSGFYSDPMDDPVGFSVGVLAGAPIYLASQLTAPYASMSGATPWALAACVGISLLLLWLLRGLLWPLLRDDARARFLAVGALLATVPLGTTLPQDRLVFFVGLGTCGLVALAVHARLGPDATTQPTWAARALLRIKGVYMPLMFVPILFSSVNQLMGGGALALDAALPRDADAHVVLLNGPSHLPVHYQRRMRTRRGDAVATVDMLYAGAAPLHVHRAGETVLELTVERGWCATTIERIVRDPAREPFEVGQVLSLPRMRVEILEVTQRGEPRRVRFELLHRTGAPVQFFAWHQRTPAAIDLPAIGETLVLPGVGPI